MKVESGFIPLDHDLNFGPGRGLEIDVGFAFAGRFLTQFVPRMLRVRNALGGKVSVTSANFIGKRKSRRIYCGIGGNPNAAGSGPRTFNSSTSKISAEAGGTPGVP